MTTRAFTLTRHLSAPRDIVYQAWTDPAHLGWFANPGYPQAHPITVDLRVGGAWRVHMVENEQKDYVTGGVYREIVPGERLVFSWGAVGGWPALDPERLDDVPLVTVVLADAGHGTEMTVHLELGPHLSDEDVQGWFALGITAGMADTLDRLGPWLQR